MASEVHYLVRYLAQSTLGLGEIVHAFSSTEPETLAICHERFPAWFEEPGFYTLMHGTGETLTIKPEEPQP